MALDILDSNELLFREWQPKLTNKFVIEIPGFPSFLIKATSRPSKSTQVITLDHINVKKYVAGKTQWDEIDITIYDPVVPSATQAVQAWYRTCFDSVSGRTGYSTFYKKDVTIKVLGAPGEVIQMWTLKGAWIKSVNYGDLDHSDSSQMTISCTLRYDYAILVF